MLDNSDSIFFKKNYSMFYPWDKKESNKCCLNWENMFNQFGYTHLCMVNSFFSLSLFLRQLEIRNFIGHFNKMKMDGFF